MERRTQTFGSWIRTTGLCVLGAVVVGALAAASQAPREPPVGQELLDRINAVRIQLSLEPLTLNLQLSSAAQAHTNDMRDRDYFAFVAPDGRSLEEFVAPTGYEHWYITEKISSGNQPLDYVMDDWLSDPGKQKSTLLNPRVRDIGIGITEKSDEFNLLSIVLAESTADYQLNLSSSLLDLSDERQQFLDRINELRAELGRRPLHQDSRLDTAATLRAEAVLASLNESTAKREVSLYRASKQVRYRVSQIAESIALGITTPELAIEQWLTDRENREALMSSVFRDLGTGAAWGPSSQGWIVVWVQVYARPGH